MNNRQAPRRRGRGNNNRTQNNNRNGYDNQNRIDNRARGNAAQMLEKYKKMAQDTQLNGDRVQAEYYHQFADHYFRVLADFKGRQEEGRQARGEWRIEDRESGEERDWRDEERDTGENDGNDNAEGEREERDDRRPQRQERPVRQERPERQDRNERQERPERTERNDRQDRLPERQDRPERQERPERQARPERNDRQPRNDRPRRERPERDGNRAIDAEPAGLDLAVLPPAIGVPSNDVEAAPAAEAAPVRKPRARKPKVVEAVAAAE